MKTMMSLFDLSICILHTWMILEIINLDVSVHIEMNEEIINSISVFVLEVEEQNTWH